MPVLAGTYNIIADQGATFSRAFIKKDDEKRIIPLTGYTARMQVRQTYESVDTLLDLNTENGYITIDGPRGIISIVVPDNDTRILTPGEYVYDLELIYPSPNLQVERMLMGTFTVRREVTR